MLQMGKTYLVSMRGNFLGPDGRKYDALFGAYNGEARTQIPDEGFLQFGESFVSIGEVAAIVAADAVSADAPIEQEFDGTNLLCLRGCHSKILRV